MNIHRIGGYRIRPQATLRHTGVGAYTELTPYPDAGNWPKMADDSTTTTVYTNGETHKMDTYAFTPNIPPDMFIRKVSVKISIMSNTQYGVAYAYQLVRIGSTNYRSSLVTCARYDGIYTDYTYEWLTNPAGGAWFAKDVNSLQAGVELWRAAGGDLSVCAAVRLYVE